MRADLEIQRDGERAIRHDPAIASLALKAAGVTVLDSRLVISDPALRP